MLKQTEEAQRPWSCILVLLVLSVMCMAQGPREMAEANPSRFVPKPAPPSALMPPAKPSSVSLSPAVVMTKGSFGQSITQTLTLTNDAPMEMSFDLIAQDVVVSGGNRVFVPAGQTPGSIAATAVFSAKSITIKPNATGSVDVHFTVPQGSAVRAVVALFRGTNRITSRQAGVAMTASLGTLITFTLSDNFKVSAQPIRLADSNDATVNILEGLTNTGTEPIVPEGMVAILDESGALLAKAPITAQRLLPGEHLDFKAQCAAAMLNAGKYRVLASYKFEDRTVTEAGEITLR